MTLVSSAQPEMGARAAPGPDSQSVILNSSVRMKARISWSRETNPLPHGMAVWYE